MASLQQHAVESWDDDADFADLNLHRNHAFTNSLSTVKTSASSRHSIRSESNAGEDDWQVPLTPNDDASINKAISSAKDAGIPIPANVPTSALLGGQIKRLGNSKKKPLQHDVDDWGDDLDLPAGSLVNLKVKPTATQPHTPAAGDDFEESDDWADGSLGVRFGGTRRGSKNRSSSASAMSPSLGSNLTVESDDEGLNGLVLPAGPLNFEAVLKKRKAAEADDPAGEPVNAAKRGPSQAVVQPYSSRADDHDDFFADIDFGPGGVFDPKKRTLNRNVKPTWKSNRETAALPKAQTTLTFTDKATTRIPRPVSATKAARLEPVFESGASNFARPRRPEATTTSAQLLRSKRSMPALRSHQPTLNKAPSVPFLTGGHAYSNSYHVPASARALQPQHLRRDSDSTRPQSPTPRSQSRLSAGMTPETPTRSRKDVAPAALAREAAAKRSVTRPMRRRNFGDGTELDSFDDLPTSASKETKYVRNPVIKPAGTTPVAPRHLRSQASQSRLGMRERTVTPLPPSSPIKSGSLPRFARDTAASRIAREQTLGPAPRPRGEALGPRINWSAQVAARSPQSSPNAKRAGRRGPTLINPMGKENVHHFQDDAAKKGMNWNAALCRWEGNDNALVGFEAPRAASPPRPALITNLAGRQGVQVVGGMVFDPQRMCWLKMRGPLSDVASPVGTEDDDPFKGIDDLHDTATADSASLTAGATGLSGGGGDFPVGEEFDLGPEFIRRQREEEVAWRSRTSAWVSTRLEGHGDEYKWAIREITML